MFTRLYGLETVTIRYFNVFGPRQDPSSPYSGVISLFIKALFENQRPKIYGDGEHTRDFTYVANVVDGVLRACQAKDASGEVINVATNGRVSLNQLFTTLRGLIGATVEPIYDKPRAGDVKDSQADISKAARLLGYKPIVTFEQGLKNTVEWYRTVMEAAPAARRVRRHKTWNNLPSGWHQAARRRTRRRCKLLNQKRFHKRARMVPALRSRSIGDCRHMRIIAVLAILAAA